MAVAQAQHVVRELGELLEENGTDVKYGIHPPWQDAWSHECAAC